MEGSWIDIVSVVISINISQVVHLNPQQGFTSNIDILQF